MAKEKIQSINLVVQIELPKSFLGRTHYPHDPIHDLCVWVQEQLNPDRYPAGPAYDTEVRPNIRHVKAWPEQTVRGQS